MAKKRTYQAVRVQQVQVAELLPLLVAGCVIALDVAKQKLVVALATTLGEVVKLFRFDHPTETRDFLRLSEELRCRLGEEKVVAAMEPTGTYGDAIRWQLRRAGVPVHMVSPKRTHDSRELFDGVPSMHDPKSAVLIARLHGAMKLSSVWREPSEAQRRLRALVEMRQHEQRREEQCHGQLEAMVARHWPELGQWMDVRRQRSPLYLLMKYPSPLSVAGAPEEVRDLLHTASRRRLSAEAIDGVVEGARTTLGVPMVMEEAQWVRLLATQVLESIQRTEALDAQMREVAKHDEIFSRLSTWMGTYTAAVIVTHVDPRQCDNTRQLEKACGMNLREKSSGESKGKLSITKRGPGVVRQVLYLFALRMIQESAAVRAWYEQRRGYTEESRTRAVVAVMRKLVRAMFHVARGNDFDVAKLFDLRRLDLETRPAPTPTGLTSRTTPRPIARGRRRAKRSGAEVASA